MTLIPPVLPRYRARDYFREGYPLAIMRTVHRRDEFSRWQYRRREFWKLVYVISGRGTCDINRRRFALKPGCIYLAHPEDDKAYLIQSDTISIINLLFHPSLIFPELATLAKGCALEGLFNRGGRSDAPGLAGVLCLHERRPRAYLAHLVAMEREYGARAEGWRSVLRLKLLELLILLTREAATQVQRVESAQLADFLRRYIEEHYAEDLTLTGLARVAGYRPAYTSSLFHAQAGQTLFEYLRQVRIREARRLLRETPRPVLEVGQAVGFRDPSLFQRTFRRLVGEPPQKWRQSQART